MSYPWFSLYQRPNHFARQFKRHGFGVEVIEMRQLVRLNSILNRMRFEEHRRDIDRLWSVVKIPFIGLENFQLSRKIRKILAAHEQGSECIFWLQGFDDALDYGRLMPLLTGTKILDVSDSFPDFFTDPDVRKRLEAAEKTVAAQVDVVLATADVLYDKFLAYNPRTFLIKNGVDLSRYENIMPPSDTVLRRKVEATAPATVIGYQGGIASWFDYDLMDYVIRNNPDFIFLFAGMVDVRSRRDFGRIVHYRNVLHLGAVDPEVLPWVLSRINVGIIPFKINDLIRATNPIKLYEYLAAGKPVVATPMLEVMRYEAKGMVATAEDPEAFSRSLREMASLAEEPSLHRERLMIGHDNSWNARFRKILEHVPELRTADLP